MDPVSSIRKARLAARRAGPLNDPLPDRWHSQHIFAADAQDETARVARCKIEGYRVRRIISAGGQGTVFEAIQESTGRTVAVKVIGGGPFISSEARIRYQREVNVLALLHHPAIVVILDCGRTADGSFFVATEFVAGERLDASNVWGEATSGGDVRRCLKLFAVIAAAMDEVHHAEVIHRDLKPANILIDLRGEPRIIDFGLAQLELVDDRTATITGKILGSLPWTSPEQADAGLEGVDARSDIYSLGVMLYQAITGRYPYEVHASTLAVIRNIRFSVPPRPSRFRSGTSAVNEAHLDAVVLKALAKAPQDRYATAGEMAADLLRCADGEAVIARRPRSRWMPPLLSLGILAMVASTGVELLAHRRSSTPAPIVTVFELPGHRNSIGMGFALIPAGQIALGSPLTEPGRGNDEIPHQAILSKPFFLSVTEVTRGQYRSVMNVNAAGEGSIDQLPASGISWDAACEFCRRLGQSEGRTYRLPTEAEWEYACRAGSIKAFSGTGQIDSMGWHAGNSSGRLRPVASLSPNAWGIYDMHGGVCEWCSDEDLNANPPDTAGVRQYHVTRGGDINRPAEYCRSASRKWHFAEEVPPYAGFRVVLSDK